MRCASAFLPPSFLQDHQMQNLDATVRSPEGTHAIFVQSITDAYASPPLQDNTYQCEEQPSRLCQVPYQTTCARGPRRSTPRYPAFRWANTPLCCLSRSSTQVRAKLALYGKGGTGRRHPNHKNPHHMIAFLLRKGARPQAQTRRVSVRCCYAEATSIVLSKLSP